MLNTDRSSPAVKGERYRNTIEASKYLKEVWGIDLAAATLNTLRTRGGGPKYRKCGPAVRYGESNLDEHAQALLSEPVSNTSEYREQRTQREQPRAPRPALAHQLKREPTVA